MTLREISKKIIQIIFIIFCCLKRAKKHNTLKSSEIMQMFSSQFLNHWQTDKLNQDISYID